MLHECFVIVHVHQYVTRVFCNCVRTCAQLQNTSVRTRVSYVYVAYEIPYIPGQSIARICLNKHIFKSFSVQFHIKQVKFILGLYHVFILQTEYWHYMYSACTYY